MSTRTISVRMRDGSPFAVAYPRPGIRLAVLGCVVIFTTTRLALVPSGTVAAEPTTPSSKLEHAMALATAGNASSDKPAASRLPTPDEYLVSNCRLLLDDDKSNDPVAHYRIGWLLLITSQSATLKDALTMAADEFLAATTETREAAKYLYLHYRSKYEFECEAYGTPNRDEGSDLDTLYTMLIDKDLRYYAHAATPHVYGIDYLVLLLEDDAYEQQATKELKALPDKALFTLLGYLKYPYYCDTSVERTLLDVLAGREPIIIEETKDVIANLKAVQLPRLSRYRDKLVISEVEVFTPHEIENLSGGKRQANSIRAAQLERVVVRTKGAFDYIDSRLELYEALLARASVVTTHRETKHP